MLSYVGFDQLWSYADVQEVTFFPVTEVILFAVIGPFALFMIALLFLVAGLRDAAVAGAQGSRAFCGRPATTTRGARSLCSLSACGLCSCTRCTRSARRPDRTGRSSSRAATSIPVPSGSWVCY